MIVDVRENRGGDPTGVALVTSYLFDEPTHLNDVYFRRENRTQQFWTAGSMSGRRLSGRDVYVLTSSRTFSAGEVRLQPQESEARHDRRGGHGRRRSPGQPAPHRRTLHNRRAVRPVD
jgi:hypothetical protein